MNKNLILFLVFICLGYVRADCAANATLQDQTCQCNQGYYGTDASTNGACQQCPLGTTTDPNLTNGDVSLCNQCILNYYMTKAAVKVGTNIVAAAATCTACPNGSGTLSGPTKPGDISQCDYCLENFFMTQNAYGPSNLANNQFASAAQCSPCPTNSHAPFSKVIGFCKCFDQNAIDLSPTVTSCACKRGYSGTVASTQGAPTGCTQCPDGQYSMNSRACTQCGPGSYINQDKGGCICYDTSEGTIPWNFSKNVCQCQFNYYGDPSKATKITSGSCVPCPDGTSSPNGSVASSQCVLNSSSNSNKNQNDAGNSIILSLSLSLSLLFILI